MSRTYRRGDTALTDQLVVKIHPDTRDALERCREHGESLSALVRRILSRYLSRR